MKKIIQAFMALSFSFFALVGCTRKNNTLNNSSKSNSDGSIVKTSDDKDTNQHERILITFFSRADENYGVGIIEKGNTQILAEIIQEKTNGFLFHIQRNTPYPASYSDCIKEVQNEKGTRPTLLEDLDISKYDVIFIGYPIWYGDMPMPVYTFIENKDWQNKKVVPFSTNEGSGLAGTINSITSKCIGADILKALSMRGSTVQNDRVQAQQQVEAWVEKLNIV